MAIFPSFYFRQNTTGKCVIPYSRKKKPLSRQKVNKAKKLRFFQRGQSKVLVKNWQFFHVFILGITGQKDVFHHNLERKNGFLDFKNNNLIQSKNWDLSKGVSPWFWSKIRNYSILLFQPKHYGKMCLTNFYKEKTPSQTKPAKTLRENVFDELLQRENTFVDNKNNKLINSKNWDFSKGVSPWVWSKISNFSMFLCQAKQARKMCFTIIQRGKTAFLTLKTTT